MLPNKILHYKQGELFPFPEWNPDMSSESCSETQFKTADLEYAQNCTQRRHWLRHEKLWRCGNHYQDFSVTLPAQRQQHTNMIVPLLFQEGLGCEFHRLPPAFHPVYKCHVPRLAAAALHQEKRRHSLAAKGHENCLGSAAKKALEVLGGRKNFLL